MALELLNKMKGKMQNFLGLEAGTNFIFVGNPGVGKSTILNGLTDSTHFHSGVSENGAGMTKVTTKLEKHGVTWWDSPGLADMEMRKEAAHELQKLFNMGGKYKIFFVVTTEAGRIRPADKLTIDEILGSLKNSAKQVHYGVIINKMEATEYKNFNDPNHQFRQKVLTMINYDATEDAKNKGINKSIHMLGLPRYQDLVTQPTNNKIPVVEELNKFLVTVPPVELTQGKATLIEISNARFTEQQKINERIMTEMNRNMEFFKQVAKKNQATIDDLLAQQNRRDAQFDKLRKDLEDAKNQAKQAGVKVPRGAASGGIFDVLGNLAGGLATPFGLGDVAKGAVKGVGDVVKGIGSLFGL